MKPEDHAEQPFFATMQQSLPSLHSAFQVLIELLSNDPEIKKVISKKEAGFSEIIKGLQEIDDTTKDHNFHAHLMITSLMRALCQTQEILEIKKRIFSMSLGAQWFYEHNYPHHPAVEKHINNLIIRCSKAFLLINVERNREKMRMHASVMARKSRAVRSKKQQQEKNDLLAEGIACLKAGHPTHKRHWNDVSEVARHMALTQGYPERKMADLLRRYVRDLTAQEQSLLPLRRKSTPKKITPNA